MPPVRCRTPSRPRHSYGVHSYGLYGYGLYSYGPAAACKRRAAAPPPDAVGAALVRVRHEIAAAHGEGGGGAALELEFDVLVRLLGTAAAAAGPALSVDSMLRDEVARGDDGSAAVRPADGP